MGRHATCDVFCSMALAVARAIVKMEAEMRMKIKIQSAEYIMKMLWSHHLRSAHSHSLKLVQDVSVKFDDEAVE